MNNEVINILTMAKVIQTAVAPVFFNNRYRGNSRGAF